MNDPCPSLVRAKPSHSTQQITADPCHVGGKNTHDMVWDLLAMLTNTPTKYSTSQIIHKISEQTRKPSQNTVSAYKPMSLKNYNE